MSIRRITDKGITYRFVWFGANGWVPLNKNDSRRIAPAPSRVWKRLADQLERDREAATKSKCVHDLAKKWSEQTTAD